MQQPMDLSTQGGLDQATAGGTATLLRMETPTLGRTMGAEELLIGSHRLPHSPRALLTDTK